MAKAKESKVKMTFSFKAPEAQSVQVVGDFTGWQQGPLPLKKQRGGVWKTTVSLPPGNYEYRLLVDGEWQDDPNCTKRRPNQFGGQNCVCEVESSPVAVRARAPIREASAARNPAGSSVVSATPVL